MNRFFLLILLFPISTGLFSQNLKDGFRKKDVPFFLEYNQMERGFLSIEADCRFHYGDENGYPSFRIGALSAGYNFWHNDWILEQKTYFNFFLLSAGLCLSYIDQLDNAERSAFGIKPQLGFDLYALKFYYGYQFTFGNRPEYLNYHNLTLSYFIFAKDDFYRRRDRSRWYSWGSIYND